QHLFESFGRLSLSDFTGRYGVLVQRAGKSDRLFDLSCGFRAKHFSNGENHSCMEFLAKDFNCPKLVASFKMMNYQAIFKNGINARLLAKLFQQAIVMFRRNVDEYFHGIRASNPVTPRVIGYVCAAEQFELERKISGGCPLMNFVKVRFPQKLWINLWASCSMTR